MSSISGLELDFLGLSLVDTPPLQKKNEKRKNRLVVEPSSRSSHLIDLTNIQDEKTNNKHLNTEIESSSSHIIDLTTITDEERDDLKARDVFPNQEISSSNLVLTDSKNTQRLDELESNSIWNYDADQKLFVLNSKCSTYDSTIQWPKITLSSKIHTKLYPHQKIGVRWLASLHNRFQQYGIGGGILGDDMGLGKTIQTLAFIGGLFACQTIRNALVICPVSVVDSWKNEATEVFKLCGISSTASVMVLDSHSRKSIRNSLLNFAMVCGKANPCLLITTYGLLKTNLHDCVPTIGDSKRFWDYVILDEGQCIKNSSTQLHKSCSRVATNPQTRRLLLTGTPIQNNLTELWSLFDWATSGKLLGKLQTFNSQFAVPIENGRNKDASEWTLRTAECCKKKLQSKLQPHFLQRSKADELKHVLTKKRELVVWTHLSCLQRKLYEKYLVDGGKVTALLSGDSQSPLEAISWLKKLCAHPCLVHEHSIESTINQSESLLEHSAKLQVLLSLISRLNQSGHRFLVFSQSTKMLDIIERVVPLSLARIDGKTKNRQLLVDIFNSKNSPYDGMLLSTKAAGVGITLTGADRAIVYDPSWNPADDSQAVDRCYRIGQRSNVTVYRLITAGTVEERMYEKQVYKDGIRHAVMTSDDSMRYFSRDEIANVFRLMPAGECLLMQRLQQDPDSVIGGSGKKSILENHPQVIGITSHDSLY